MLITFSRAIIIYIFVLCATRLMGKREIGQLQPFEFAIALMLADLGTIPMADVGIPLVNGIVPMLGLILMHVLISIINIKSIKVRQAICGKPRILIFRGKIDETAMKKERFTITELQEKLRSKDVFSLTEVEYAILETNGDITVVRKPGKRGLIPEDLGLKPKYDGLAYDLVIDGNIMDKNLKEIGKDRTFLFSRLEEFGMNPKNTLIATIDGKGEMFCQKKEKNK